MSESEPPPLQYLLECSQHRLKTFMLAKLNRSTNHRKDVRDVLEKWVEERALALLAEWLLTHGAEILAMAGNPPQLKEPPIEIEDHVNEKALTKPGPQTYEFWRSMQRHARKRA